MTKSLDFAENDAEALSKHLLVSPPEQGALWLPPHIHAIHSRRIGPSAALRTRRSEQPLICCLGTQKDPTYRGVEQRAGTLWRVRMAVTLSVFVTYQQQVNQPPFYRRFPLLWAHLDHLACSVQKSSVLLTSFFRIDDPYVETCRSAEHRTTSENNTF